MNTKKLTRILQVISASIISGVIFGLLLKMIEQSMDIKVYTLLLNIDYLLVLKGFQFAEWIEFSFHLIISMLIAFILEWLLYRFNWSNRQILLNVLLSQLIIAILLYPTTALSTRTPAITSIEAMSYWALGHLLYGLLLGLLLQRTTIQRKN